LFCGVRDTRPAHAEVLPRLRIFQVGISNRKLTLANITLVRFYYGGHEILYAAA
jgi:hypothetical protein